VPDRIYTSIPLYDRRGERAQLRVSAVRWKGSWKAHVREYYPDDKGAPTPGRGIAFNMGSLDDVLYALGLMADDLAAGRLEAGDAEPEAGGGEAAHEEQEPKGAGGR
jgi:hypothetical protein